MNMNDLSNTQETVHNVVKDTSYPVNLILIRLVLIVRLFFGLTVHIVELS